MGTHPIFESDFYCLFRIWSKDLLIVVGSATTPPLTAERLSKLPVENSSTKTSENSLPSQNVLILASPSEELSAPAHANWPRCLNAPRPSLAPTVDPSVAAP